MEYFLDTNIYRNLVRGLTKKEVFELSLKMKLQEKKLGISAGFPIVVAMELINHLRTDDPHCDECFKALCLLFNHSKNLSIESGNLQGTFFPPLNVILPKYFFNEDGPFLNIYKTIIPLTMELVKDFDINNIKRSKKEIAAVTEQLLSEKKEIFDNLANYLKSINGGNLDWEYFKNNKKEREKWFREMKTGKTFAFLAEGFMIRAYSITGREFKKNSENFAQYREFHEAFFPALAMTSIILMQVGHGTLAISDVKDHRWNTVTDISMMFGALYNSNLKNIVFVTEEKKMHEFFNLNNMENNIIGLQEYKYRMNI